MNTKVGIHMVYYESDITNVDLEIPIYEKKKTAEFKVSGIKSKISFSGATVELSSRFDTNDENSSFGKEVKF